MGRDRKNERGKGEHWTKMLRETVETPAWRALPTAAQALYPIVKPQWRGQRADNNGRIRLSTRQAATALGVSVNTAATAFHALQAKGFIVVTRPARLGVGGAASAPLFELTELAMPGKMTGQKLFLKWEAGRDYPVVKATAHNPSGANGKTKPCLENEDVASSILRRPSETRHDY